MMLIGSRSDDNDDEIESAITTTEQNPNYTRVGVPENANVEAVFKHKYPNVESSPEYLLVMDDGNVVTTKPNEGWCDCGEPTDESSRFTRYRGRCDHIDLTSNIEDTDKCECGSWSVVAGDITLSSGVAVVGDGTRCAECGCEV